MTESRVHDLLCPRCGRPNPAYLRECAQCREVALIAGKKSPIFPRITVGSLMLLVAIVAVYITIFSANGGVGLFLSFISGLAMVRVERVTRAQRRRELEIDATDYLVCFLVSLAIWIIAISFGAAVFVAGIAGTWQLMLRTNDYAMKWTIVVLCGILGIGSTIFVMTRTWRERI